VLSPLIDDFEADRTNPTSLAMLASGLVRVPTDQSGEPLFFRGK
jgi:hypothetical protein